MCGALPEGELVQVLLFPKMPSVIGPEDDEGVFGGGAGVEGIEQASDERIAEADGGLP